MERHVDVSGSGAVILGRHVSCDGFHFGAPIRVQTHVHADHLRDFDTSKGHQRLLMSQPTKDLLIAERNADLKYRNNIDGVPVGSCFDVEELEFEFLDSHHMLGGVQVSVTQADGLRLGYSSDIGWPVSRPIRVDELVIDSTSGSPGSVRRYSQSEAISELVDLVSRSLLRGPVMIKAHRGTLHRALEALRNESDLPVIAGQTTQSELAVYRRYGMDVGYVIASGTPEATEVQRLGRYVEFAPRNPSRHTDTSNTTTIVLSSHATTRGGPVVEYSDRSYLVGLTDHADHDELLQYVEATGASLVVTDNTRGGHAIELAMSIRSHLGIAAFAAPSNLRSVGRWGE